MWRQCAAQTDSHSAYDIFSAPQSSDGLGRRISGKAPRHRGWIYSQTRPTGPNGQLPLHLGLTKTSAKDLPRSRSVRIGVVRFEKSLVANLSAKRQLSVAKLSAKRIFSLAKQDFLVANGRMAADFSSPEMSFLFLVNQMHAHDLQHEVNLLSLFRCPTSVTALVQSLLSLLAHFCGTLCRLLCGIPMLIFLDLGTPLPLTWDSL